MPKKSEFTRASLHLCALTQVSEFTYAILKKATVTKYDEKYITIRNT
jgi:hypothetical protein